MTPEEFNTFIETEEGKGLLQPLMDRRVAQAIETYKKNHPAPAELGTRLDQIEQALEQKESELQKNKLDKYLFQKCYKLEIPEAYDLLKDHPFQEEAEIDSKIENLSRIFLDKQQQILNEKLSRGPKPGSGQEPSLPRKDKSKLTRDEAIFMETLGRLDD